MKIPFFDSNLGFFFFLLLLFLALGIVGEQDYQLERGIECANQGKSYNQQLDECQETQP